MAVSGARHYAKRMAMIGAAGVQTDNSRCSAERLSLLLLAALNTNIIYRKDVKIMMIDKNTKRLGIESIRVYPCRFFL